MFLYGCKSPSVGGSKAVLVFRVALLCLGLLSQARVAPGQEISGQQTSPFTDAGVVVKETPLDKIVRENLGKRGLKPAPACSDAVFLRRAYLDVTGKIPSAAEVQSFLADRSPGKREAVIDRMLAGEEFAVLAAMRWSEVLRVKSEFPVNLWPNAVQAYHRWIYEAMRENLPYDRFATALVTSSGSNFRVPQANFYRAVPEKTPRGAAATVALTFFGQRWEAIPAAGRERLRAIFAGLAYKQTGEWKEEIVYYRPVQTDRLLLPDGRPVGKTETGDPRPEFARWMTSRTNAAFAQAGANRIWAWLLGRGVVHEPDDMRPANPTAVPGLLEYLGQEFARSRYDLRALHRLILTSATYQQSCIPQSASADAERYFACYPVRPLEAELLADLLGQITGAREDYKSLIPEPYSYVPKDNAAVALADGSISSGFLDLFGRPARDTGLFSERGTDPTEEQRRYLLNSRQIQSKISKGPVIRSLFQKQRDPSRFVEQAYLTILSRMPEPAEMETAIDYLIWSEERAKTAGDLAWALINSKEFLFHH